MTVRLITITGDYYGLSERDLELARAISAVARELGLTADPSAVQTVQVAIDALVIPEVLPFWRAPEWWTLADAEGNEADVATTFTRD